MRDRSSRSRRQSHERKKQRQKISRPLFYSQSRIVDDGGGRKGTQPVLLMNPKLKLSKLDCARRQLEMGIELYFMERDPVSIHTLAGAARQLLVDINKHRGGKPLMTEIEALKGIVILGKEKELSQLFKKAENFFKHADYDPEAIIDFAPEFNEVVLWEASVKYYELTSETTPVMGAIKIWFAARHPDLFTEGAFEQEGFKNRFQSAASWVKSLTKTQFYKEILHAALLHK
jgi:hypothetical protein